MIKPNSITSIKFHIDKRDIVCAIAKMLCTCPDTKILTKKNIDQFIRKTLHEEGKFGLLAGVQDDPETWNRNIMLAWEEMEKLYPEYCTKNKYNREQQNIIELWEHYKISYGTDEKQFIRWIKDSLQDIKRLRISNTWIESTRNT